MNKVKQGISARWAYLAIGVAAMLFAGVLYAWSILKAPLAGEFGWRASELALILYFGILPGIWRRFVPMRGC